MATIPESRRRQDQQHLKRASDVAILTVMAEKEGDDAPFATQYLDLEQIREGAAITFVEECRRNAGDDAVLTTFRASVCKDGLINKEKNNVDSAVLAFAQVAGLMPSYDFMDEMREIIDRPLRPTVLPAEIILGPRGGTFIRFPIGGDEFHQIPYGTRKGMNSWSKDIASLLTHLAKGRPSLEGACNAECAKTKRTAETKRDNRQRAKDLTEEQKLQITEDCEKEKKEADAKLDKDLKTLALDFAEASSARAYIDSQSTPKARLEILRIHVGDQSAHLNEESLEWRNLRQVM